jgi:adenine-specific DNA-methyltransferase
VKKKGATTPTDPVNDYLLWYTKDIDQVRVRRLTAERGEPEDDPKFNTIVSQDGEHRRTKDAPRSEIVGMLAEGWEWVRVNYPIVSQHPHDARSDDFKFRGSMKKCGSNKQWRFEVPQGLERLNQAERLFDGGGESLGGILRWKDWPHVVLSNFWDDTKGEESPICVVQTAWRVLQRCILMTTDPGDLVLDPTCGSGTTAFMAEQWGRRWITIDTSRVALALARQRLMTARFPYYQLRALNAEDLERNPGGTWLTDPSGKQSGKVTFKCKTVPHITLKSIARNTLLDPIFAKHEPILAARLDELNAALKQVAATLRQRLAGKLLDKQKREGKKAIADADRRRWELPKKAWEHWEVPFDTDPDWPQALQDAVTAYRKAWRAKMDEVNACIAANAQQEELVNQPEEVKGVVRVTGPFTVEAVQPPEVSLDEEGDGKFDGSPEQLAETFEGAPAKSEVKNVEAYLDQMTRLLRTDGVRFPNNKQMRFTGLEPIQGGASGLHAEGRWVPEGETDADVEGRAMVAVGSGPQYGPVTAKQVEELVRSASRRGYDDLVVAGFSFDGPVQAVIEEAQHPKLHIHMAHIRPDVNPGMAGLLKEDKPGSQLFSVFGLPRTRLDGPDSLGEYTVTMEGVDIYNPLGSSIVPTGADKVAAWFLDSDYDGRTFCITQAFFPDRTAWDKLSKVLTGVVDPERFEALSGTVSLPFPLGQNKCVAVKVIDPRGNEVMRVHRLEYPHG